MTRTMSNVQEYLVYTTFDVVENIPVNNNKNRGPIQRSQHFIYNKIVPLIMGHMPIHFLHFLILKTNDALMFTSMGSSS